MIKEFFKKSLLFTSSLLLFQNFSFGISAQNELNDYFKQDLADWGEIRVEPYGQPFLYNQKELKTQSGVILVHGFAAYPNELKNLGKYLKDQGFVVYGVRLAGHGTSPEQMMKTSWKDWYQSVESVYRVMKNNLNKVYAIGSSAGGNLVLKLAAEEDLDGIVCISTPIDFREENIKFARYIVPAADLFRINLGYRSWGEPTVVERNYAKYPTRSLYELLQIVDQAKKGLPDIVEPILILQGRDDTTTNPTSANYIHKNTGSRIKHLEYIEGAHVDYIYRSNQPLYTRIARFLTKQQ